MITLKITPDLYESMITVISNSKSTAYTKGNDSVYKKCIEILDEIAPNHLDTKSIKEV